MTMLHMDGLCHGEENAEVCQILFWWTKYSLHSINIRDTVTEVLPLYSVYQAPFYESDLTLLAWFLPDIAYLSMLFNLVRVCTAVNADPLKNK